MKVDMSELENIAIRAIKAREIEKEIIVKKRNGEQYDASLLDRHHQARMDLRAAVDRAIAKSTPP